jgi:predicted Fe-S protein YdhL (DUF1289 family)
MPDGDVTEVGSAQRTTSPWVGTCEINPLRGHCRGRLRTPDGIAGWLTYSSHKRAAGRRYASTASTSQNTNPSRSTVSPTWQAIVALKTGPA